MKQVLATDLDGTLIPLDGNTDNRNDLQLLKKELDRVQVELLFVTGRHAESVMNAITHFDLPTPNWVICDVGTTIMQRDEQGDFFRVDAYREALLSLTHSMAGNQIRSLLEPVNGLRLQENEKQGEFKISYYCPANERIDISTMIQDLLHKQSAPYSIISSVDPFTGDGLIDLLPENVSKAYALNWWTQTHRHSPDSIVFAGDSGNDMAALTAGYRAIVVGNASQEVVKEAQDLNAQANHLDRLFIAEDFATSGVLSGCRHFGIFKSNTYSD